MKFNKSLSMSRFQNVYSNSSVIACYSNSYSRFVRTYSRCPFYLPLPNEMTDASIVGHLLVSCCQWLCKCEACVCVCGGGGYGCDCFFKFFGTCQPYSTSDPGQVHLHGQSLESRPDCESRYRDTMLENKNKTKIAA